MLHLTADKTCKLGQRHFTALSQMLLYLSNPKKQGRLCRNLVNRRRRSNFQICQHPQEPARSGGAADLQLRSRMLHLTADKTCKLGQRALHSPLTDAFVPEQSKKAGQVVQKPGKQKAAEQLPNLPALGKYDVSSLPETMHQQSSIAKGICNAAIRKSQQEAAAAIAAGCLCVCKESVLFQHSVPALTHLYHSKMYGDM